MGSDNLFIDSRNNVIMCFAKVYNAFAGNWPNFINSLDIGISINLMASSKVDYWVYDITDPHKWFLAKIKHAI